ncbi:MAG TPA: hypothetical protein VFS77_09780 [Pyrinomonadaceae bacterium]|nr:hypothetical protein [Pyrinomonadaceae bacterium]
MGILLETNRFGLVSREWSGLDVCTNFVFKISLTASPSGSRMPFTLLDRTFLNDRCRKLLLKCGDVTGLQEEGKAIDPFGARMQNVQPPSGGGPPANMPFYGAIYRGVSWNSTSL